MKSFLLAIQFLSIVPVRVKGDVSADDMLRSTVAYPVVGLLLGAMLICADMLFASVFSSSVVSALLVLVIVLFTGALHLDGLGDTADALGVRGNRERKLQVMRDSSAGPMAVVAIVFALALRYLLIDELSNLTYFIYYFTLVIMPAFGRWSMLAGMLIGKPARDEGLGNIFIGKLGAGRFCVATLLLLMPAIGAQMIFKSSNIPEYFLIFIIVLLGACFFFALMLSQFVKKKFGGHTGDTLGGQGELVEILMLMGVLVWSRLYTL